jgi:hypothetical protein
MLYPRLGVALTVAALCTASAGARCDNLPQFPAWKGQWVRIGAGGLYDPTKPPGRGQQPPLTPEYQALWEAHIAEGRAGGQYYNPQVRCMPSGMPRMMVVYEPMEVIMLPEATYIHITFNNEFRRIYTDGRSWPEKEEPSFTGYSIGRWIDENGDGRYDVLEAETRNFKGPRIFEPSGIPLHKDNATIVKERIFLDKADANILRDEITTIDNALTRPWTVTRSYRRAAKNAPITEHSCGENNEYVFIEGQTYQIGIDGKLTPTRRDQPPPDLGHFK